MSKRVKKEILPFIVAVVMLILLIGALIYTILYKPKTNNVTKSENTLTAEEVLVNNTSNTCGNYNIANLSEEAKKVKLSYEIIDDYSYGTVTIVDSGNGDDLQNAKGYALRIKVTDLTNDMYIRINNKTTNTTNDYYKADIDNKGFVYDDGYNIELQLLDVKIMIKNEECKNIVLREFETTLPRYNQLAKAGLCTTDEYKDKDVCSTYIFNDDSYETQLDKLNKEKEKVEKETTSKNKKNEETEKNKKWIRIIVVACVLIVITVAGVIVMKGSKKHEKK